MSVTNVCRAIIEAQQLSAKVQYFYCSLLFINLVSHI